MFRATVHTSFVVDNVLRLTRDELDGACQNENYPNDFFIDLIFTDARNQSNMILAGSQGI
jgi:tensin